MKHIIYVTISLVFLTNTLNAQENTFESKMKNLSMQIDKTIETEKALLKTEIKKIEKQYNNDVINYKEATVKKNAATKLHADNIKNDIIILEKEVHSLVQGKVDDKIKNIDSKKIKNKNTYNWSFPSSNYENKRTYMYLFTALGMSNTVYKNKLNSNFKWNSGNAELGFNFKSRVLKNSGLLYLNYGFSYLENNYKVKNNQYFDTTENQTTLTTHSENLKHSKFTTQQIMAPLFFELDFSKPKIEDGKTIFRRNNSWRIGFGGFGGINIGSKQYIKYKQDGKKIKARSKGDYNVTKFIYGLQGLIGYKDTSLYIKYDLQNLFTNNLKSEKNISFGIRFDL